MTQIGRYLLAANGELGICVLRLAASFFGGVLDSLDRRRRGVLPGGGGDVGAAFGQPVRSGCDLL